MKLLRILSVASVAAGFGLVASACFGNDALDPKNPDSAPLVRGAIYIPASAFNAPQMWKNFSLEETRRDFGFAKKINLNALRIWASYEYWRAEPEHFKKSFDQMLGAAQDSGIRVLVSLFENCGVPPTPENMWTTDPRKAFAINSPDKNISLPAHREQWDQPREFVKWFMQTYGSDPRLIAIEVMNEPGSGGPKPTMPFAKSMFQTAAAMRGSVALTVGTVSVHDAIDFIPLGLDIIEYHDNFPPGLEAFETTLQNAVAAGKQYRKPVWLTEWQRLRPGASGWGKRPVPGAETLPDYSSLAATVQKYPVGNFFWSLMMKRAYLPPQREKGTVNGLFWTDGSVWSLADARAIAKDPALQLPERKTLPPDFLAYLKKAE